MVLNILKNLLMSENILQCKPNLFRLRTSKFFCNTNAKQRRHLTFKPATFEHSSIKICDPMKRCKYICKI